MRLRCSSLNTSTWSVHSRRAEPIKRSTRPFCQGERKDVGRSRMPITRTRALNAAPKARSLSRMRYFGAVSHGNAFSDLACQPLGRRVAGHRKPQQLPTFVAENKTCEELLKRNRRNHEQINTTRSPPYDCEGRSSKSAMADPAAVLCRRKPWTGRPRYRV